MYNHKPAQAVALPNDCCVLGIVLAPVAVCRIPSPDARWRLGRSAPRAVIDLAGWDVCFDTVCGEQDAYAASARTRGSDRDRL